jgi:hypothetical protein
VRWAPRASAAGLAAWGPRASPWLGRARWRLLGSPDSLQCGPPQKRTRLKVHLPRLLASPGASAFPDMAVGSARTSSFSVLPAGAVAGWGLHPLEKGRLVTAHAQSGHLYLALTAYFT